MATTTTTTTTVMIVVSVAMIEIIKMQCLTYTVRHKCLRNVSLERTNRKLLFIICSFQYTVN